MSAMASLSPGCLAASAKATHFHNHNAKAVSFPVSANSNSNPFFSFSSIGLAFPPLPISTKSSSVKTAVAAVESDQISSSGVPSDMVHFYSHLTNSSCALCLCCLKNAWPSFCMLLNLWCCTATSQEVLLFGCKCKIHAGWGRAFQWGLVWAPSSLWRAQQRAGFLACDWAQVLG